MTINSTWSPANGTVLCLNGYGISLNGNGPVIEVQPGVTFTLCDCNGSSKGGGITHASSSNGRGAGVLVGRSATDATAGKNTAEFNMYGGAIYNNYPWEASGENAASASGVLIGGGTFNMYGGAITGNNCGVNVNSNDFIVAGKVNITGNKSSDGKTSNVYLPANKTITVSGALGENAKIGVTTAKELAKGSYLTIATGKDYTLTETDLKAFTSDSSYGKRLNGNSIIFTNGDLHIHALCGASCTHTGTHSDIVWQPLTYDAETQTLYYGGTATSKANDGSYKLPAGNYYLTDNITVDNGITITGNVNLCLNGKTLSTTVNDKKVDVIGVNSQNGKCTLTLCDCDTAGRGTITSQHKTNSGVQIYGYRDGETTTYGNLVMYGGTVKGFRNGVFVGDGTFNMFGGTITGNECGVSTSSNASFTIGGTVNITGNTKNVDLAEDETITIDKSLTQEARIGVCLRNKYIPTGTVKKQFAIGATNSDLNYGTIFSCDNGSQYVVSKDGDSLSFGLHQHSWEYELSTDGKAITATCTEGGCPLENRIGGSVTISASNAVYDRSSKATVTANDWKGVPVNDITVTYTGRNGTNYNSTDAPTNAGEYTASITLGEGENAKTASVEYSIEKASMEYTVPTGLTAKYGQTLADISLPTGWAWEDGTQSVGSVGEHTFKATYTPDDANFHAVTGIDVTVTVNKAPVTIQITGMPKGPIAYGDTFALTITQTGDSNAVPANWTRFSNDRHFEYLKEQSNPEKGEFKFQATGVCSGNGCSRKFTVEFESDTHKGSLTVSTPNVTKKMLTKEDLVFGGLTTDFTKIYDGSTSFTKARVEIRSGAKVNVTDALPAVNGSYVYNSKDVKDAKKVIFTSKRTESENYILPAGLTVEHAAGITQATPTYTVPADLTAKYGQTLADISLPDGWAWMDSTLSVDDVSNAAKTFKAKFTPADTNNYKTVENIKVSVTVNKADGRGLKTADLTQKFTDVSDHAYTPDWSVLPGGQNWSYNSEYRVSTGSNVTLTKHDFAADGSLLTYAVSGGKAGDKITITLKASCGNYEDFTITPNITLTAKDNQAALTLTGGTTVVYGQTLQLGTSGGSGTGTVTYAVTNVDGQATVDASGKLTPVKVGTVKVKATKAEDADYNAITSAEVEITITQATPTGTPIFTKITEKDKTLADAALGIGTLNPNAGTLVWVDDTGYALDINTKVEANKEYKWLFTPTNANYTTLTGTIILYPASTGIVIYTPVNDAIFLSGANQIVAPGSAATFRINKNFGEFRSVAVDGVTLDKSNYRAWSGSTYVKLTPAYMKTLSAGTHTLAVYFTGATATTTFTISAGSSNPATGAGDFAGVGAAVAMAAVSLLGAAAVLRRK